MHQTLTIHGMSCEGCETRVHEALADVSGVQSVTVDRSREMASVDGSASASTLVAAVEDAGYDAAIADSGET